MHDLLMWLIPWTFGYLFSDLMRWLRDRRGWHTCPISTCDFGIKMNHDELWKPVMTDHVLKFHATYNN